MEDNQISGLPGEFHIERPSRAKHYEVYVINDDFTTFDFVIDVMQRVFFKTHEEAEMIALATHVKGRALVGVYSLDIAKSKVHKAVALARAQNFPLRFDIVQEGQNPSQK